MLNKKMKSSLLGAHRTGSTEHLKKKRCVSSYKVSVRPSGVWEGQGAKANGSGYASALEREMLGTAGVSTCGTSFV